MTEAEKIKKQEQLDQLRIRKAKAESLGELTQDEQQIYERICTTIKQLELQLETTCDFALPLDLLPLHLLELSALVYAQASGAIAAGIKGDAKGYAGYGRDFVQVLLDLVAADREQRGVFKELPREAVQGVFDGCK